MAKNVNHELTWNLTLRNRSRLLPLTLNRERPYAFMYHVPTIHRRTTFHCTVRELLCQDSFRFPRNRLPNSPYNLHARTYTIQDQIRCQTCISEGKSVWSNMYDMVMSRPVSRRFEPPPPKNGDSPNLSHKLNLAIGDRRHRTKLLRLAECVGYMSPTTG